jgi:hypothetical protein
MGALATPHLKSLWGSLDLAVSINHLNHPVGLVPGAFVVRARLVVVVVVVVV